METLVLKLDIAGQPVGWLTREDCALLYCRDQVVWEAGDDALHLRGGWNRLTGERSSLALNSIIATRGVDRRAGQVPFLTNARLFQRDGDLCLYCGEAFPKSILTRDHVIPLSRGGLDRWENVVTACRSCNHRKDDALLDEIDMRLLAVPYTPNRAEGLILANRRILTDQMAFLRSRVGQSSRLRAT